MELKIHVQTRYPKFNPTNRLVASTFGCETCKRIFYFAIVLTPHRLPCLVKIVILLLLYHSPWKQHHQWELNRGISLHLFRTNVEWIVTQSGELWSLCLIFYLKTACPDRYKWRALPFLPLSHEKFPVNQWTVILKAASFDLLGLFFPGS